MSSSEPSKETTQFLETFANILDKPDMKTFEWSEDGKYVFVHCQHYEEEMKEHLDLSSIFSQVKEAKDLMEFLTTQGFQKIARRSRKNILVLHHPDFSSSLTSNQRKRLVDRKLRSSDVPLAPITRRDPSMLKTEKEVAGPSWPQHDNRMQYFPVRTRVRALYQYINSSLRETQPVETETQGI